MANNCKAVIFSNKAYNEIIRESFAKHPIETGGLLLGYVVNGMWVVMEVVPPGYNGVHQTAYFEYDREFVNYLIPSISNRYKIPLQLLGLWHRHPGSMDYFSSTDDETNSEFASLSQLGVISGLVNIDPVFRLTMYHLDHFDGPRPRNVAYSKVDVEIGDDYIPEMYFELRYMESANPNLHPVPTDANIRAAQTRAVPPAVRDDADETEAIPPSVPAATHTPESPQTPPAPATAARPVVRKWAVPVIAVLILVIGVLAGVLVGRHSAPAAPESGPTEVETQRAVSAPSAPKEEPQEEPLPPAPDCGPNEMRTPPTASKAPEKAPEKPESKSESKSESTPGPKAPEPPTPEANGEN